MGTQWRTIADVLGLDNAIIAQIELRELDADKIQEVFHVWFQNAAQLPRAHYYPLSWWGLNELLKDSDLSAVAKNYFSILGGATYSGERIYEALSYRTHTLLGAGAYISTRR